MEDSRLVFILLYFVTAVYGDAADETQSFTVNTVVSTTAGKIRGSIIENLNVSYYSFKGIPYAESPVGELRFQAPIPHHKWSGVRDALKHSSICANRWGFFGVNNTEGGNEDCLFLNVYTKNIDGPKKSVMFWIHGGAFMSGSGNTDLYGPEHLLKKDVVLVTINYRYSAFGFLSTGDEHAPGNQGLKDLVLGLKWVRDNIESFGGNKDDVTIFGHSSGAVAVHFLMISDLSEELFHKAIMQSGTSLMTCLSKLDNPLPNAQLLAERLKISYTDNKDLVEKLQAVPFEDIRGVETPLFSIGARWAFDAFEYVPSIEPKTTNGAFLTEAPIDAMKRGKYKKIPIMIGSPSFEGMFVALLFYSNASLLSVFNENPWEVIPREFEVAHSTSNADVIIKELNRIYFDRENSSTLVQWLNVYSDIIFRLSNDRVARLHAANNAMDVFYYQFSFDGPLNFFKKHLGLKNFYGASHGDELFYLFQPYESEFIMYVADERSSLMRERMTTMWTNFAKYGNPTPNVDGKIITERWMPYTTESKKYFDIDDKLTNKNNPDRMDDLNRLMKQFTGHI